MPEIPDIEVFSQNLKKRVGGKKVANVKVLVEKKLKDTPKELSKALEGQKIKDIWRSGKEMRMLFSNDVVMGIHLMLTGDLYFLTEKNERKSTIIEFQFSDGTILALTDRMKNAAVKLNPVDKNGIDALDKALNHKTLKELLNRKTAVKNVLLDQDVIRGIGNGYSDEILWEARISPFSKAAAIPDEKVKELARVIKKVLTAATKKIAKHYPDILHGEVRDFMKIHTKHKTESPTGYPILIADRGMLKTYYTTEQLLYE
ncbi:MAG: DNA-formamidopyrimidine glycosylase [Flaviaesturariibacter sp.]|nr:DNA-formamidopyrimidine glycosylase [Flaviaesturariibacter sp.]